MKKLLKRFFAVVILFAVIVNCIVPITKVFAEPGYVLSFTVSGEHVMEKEGGHLKIDGEYVELRDDDDHSFGEVSCVDNTHCTITVSDEKAGKLNYNSANKFVLFMQGHEVNMDFYFSANENILVQDYVEHHNNVEPGPDGPQFDGRAVVVWSCGEGVCYHKFYDIPGFDDGNSQFYKASDVTADNKNNTVFDVNALYKGWYLEDTFDEWVTSYKEINHIEGNINWDNVDPQLIAGDPIDMRKYEDEAVNDGTCQRPDDDAFSDEWDAFRGCVDGYVHELGIVWSLKLQPLGEPNENNAYVSYGDRNFKVVIYNSNYKGITMGDLSELDYYPSQWANVYLSVDQFDISGTSKKRPALLNSILLEDTVNIKALDFNDFEIVSIEALDVPDDAVTITKVNDEFSLVFSSNFYDNVIFKVIDNNDEITYFQIKRYTIDGYIGDVGGKRALLADFYFDREKSYDDFELTAKIIYKNGDSKNVNLEANYGVDDGLGNITWAYEVDEEHPVFGPPGKGLKKALFKFELEDGEADTIQGVYLNAEYKGSTVSNYAGAYVGSGEGILANIYHPEREGE